MNDSVLNASQSIYSNARLYLEGTPLEGRDIIYISRLGMCNGTAASRLAMAECLAGKQLSQYFKCHQKKYCQVICF